MKKTDSVLPVRPSAFQSGAFERQLLRSACISQETCTKIPAFIQEGMQSYNNNYTPTESHVNHDLPWTIKVLTSFKII